MWPCYPSCIITALLKDSVYAVAASNNTVIEDLQNVYRVPDHYEAKSTLCLSSARRCTCMKCCQAHCSKFIFQSSRSVYILDSQEPGAQLAQLLFRCLVEGTASSDVA